MLRISQFNVFYKKDGLNIYHYVQNSFLIYYLKENLTSEIGRYYSFYELPLNYLLFFLKCTVIHKFLKKNKKLLLLVVRFLFNS